VPTRLAVVRAVAAALGTARTEHEVGEAVLNAVAEHLGAVTATIWLVQGDELVLVHSRNADPEVLVRLPRVALTADVPGTDVIRTGEAYYLSSRAELDERWPHLADLPSPSQALVVLPLANTGTVSGVVSFGFGQAHEFDSQDRVAFLAIADQCAIALDRARLYEAARAESAANELLARVSEAGGGSDWRRITQRITEVCTEKFVDSCGITVREGALLRRVAGSSRSYPELAGDVVARYPTPISSPAPTATAVRHRRPVHVPAPDASEQAGESPAPGYRERVAHLRFGDSWVIPLFDGPDAFGVIAFATAVGETMSPDMVALAERVAERASALIRSASEFARHRAAVDALQHVLLPAEVPEVPGWEVGACYVPFTASPTVGGDWWDGLVLPDGRLALTVGDVAGHGVPAVAVMGQLRNTMRSRLVAGLDPAESLAELNSLLDWTDPTAHATAVALLADPGTGELVWASAGHPPPLVTSAGREPRWLDVPAAAPLGALPRDRAHPYRNHHDHVAPGETLHLYSDGLIEGRRRDIDTGLELLAAAASRDRPGTPVQARCEGLVAELVQEAEDDVCLVIAHRLAPGPGPRPGRRPPPAARGAPARPGPRAR
jgi:serine phosphatase RsbU (regulator of sigma subunit)